MTEALGKGLGFELLSCEFRKGYAHERLHRDVGRSSIVAVKRGVTDDARLSDRLTQLGMTGRTFGPIDWAYGSWAPPGRRPT